MRQSKSAVPQSDSCRRALRRFAPLLAFSHTRALTPPSGASRPGSLVAPPSLLFSEQGALFFGMAPTPAGSGFGLAFAAARMSPAVSAVVGYAAARAELKAPLLGVVGLVVGRGAHDQVAGSTQRPVSQVW
jgi:hypothetical protein